MNLSSEQLAYFAGFIDGEAHIGCQKQMQRHGRTPRFVLRLSFAQATEEPLKTIGSWIDCQPKRYPSTSPNRSERWRMHIPKSKAVNLLRACIPYLILKRKQALLVLDIEFIRSENTPNRSDFGKQGGISQPMPQKAVDAMNELHYQLSSLRSNKRPIANRNLI